MPGTPCSIEMKLKREPERFGAARRPECVVT
ncbi:protein of unknown function (plasmid) [Cupriavidus taiwanensis]|uniref:Uncharacterized protein n=1 Tax=Cupriavidus taiwanensis TaxID=164546 RepID=A0A7Z7JEH3_9BURK|nr:hypothetical protein CBM2585_B50184 [Cupriavidus taiwanensis]SOZ09630.1 protein of unknown function [Cupriavidus taiwanensis]SOZ11751.1 protein of unknown function [Cupriavidus taiwanensis]SOZ43105.1 protein of unknown function [Cupriavidus taiwanensis]SPC22352.1 protein of unknown function [Cupriavidus taiwanensis]